MVKSINTEFSYTYPFETDEDYQHCFLSIFGIKDYDEKIIAEKTNALYKELKLEEGFTDLLLFLAGKMMSDDVDIGLYMLFSFDHIHDFLEMLRQNSDNTNKYNFFGFLEDLKKEK